MIQEGGGQITKEVTMAGLGNSLMVLLVTLHTVARAEIIKPMGEWLCNYCSMGMFMYREIIVN